MTIAKGALLSDVGNFGIVTISASDATAKEKERSQYVCDGSNDALIFAEAITKALSVNGKIILSSGTFTLTGEEGYNITLTDSLQIIGQKDYTKLSGGRLNILGAQLTVRECTLNFTDGIEVQTGASLICKSCFFDNGYIVYGNTDIDDCVFELDDQSMVAISNSPGEILKVQNTKITGGYYGIVNRGTGYIEGCIISTTFHESVYNTSGADLILIGNDIESILINADSTIKPSASGVLQDVNKITTVTPEETT
jgi:hypothetical protein